MMQQLKTMILEDDAFSMALLERNLTFFEQCVIVNQSETLESAKEFLLNNTPDIIFLDIQVPDGNGFDLLPFISGNPIVIVLTGDAGYAFTAFEHGVFDFLKKPFTPARFKVCMERIEKLNKKRQLSLEADRYNLFVKAGNKHVKVNLKELLYASAEADYAKLHLLGGKELLINLSLKDLTTKIEGHSFVQIHRSYLVNISHIDLVENETVLIKGIEIPIGKTYKASFQKVLNEPI